MTPRSCGKQHAAISAIVSKTQLGVVFHYVILVCDLQIAVGTFGRMAVTGSPWRGCFPPLPTLKCFALANPTAHLTTNIPTNKTSWQSFFIGHSFSAKADNQANRGSHIIAPTFHHIQSHFLHLFYHYNIPQTRYQSR